MQFACGYKCAAIWAKEEAKKKDYLEKIDDKYNGRKPKTESLSQQHALTQTSFNLWVREVKEKDAVECISCKRTRGAWAEHAGHFKSVGSAGILRYEPDNVWLQCLECNVHKSGNVAEYRKNLVEKIGLERVEWLEARAGKVYKWKIAELKDLRFKINKAIRESGYGSD